MIDKAFEEYVEAHGGWTEDPKHQLSGGRCFGCGETATRFLVDGDHCEVCTRWSRAYDQGEEAGMADVLLGIVTTISDRGEIPDEVWARAFGRAAEDFKSSLEWRKKARGERAAFEDLVMPALLGTAS